MNIETSETAVCRNKKCEDYNSYEEYEFAEVQNDTLGDYYICRSCKEKIYMEAI